MPEEQPAFHYVCTSDEAKQLINNHNKFWVSNCGCRENKGKCERSRIDLCLMFRGDFEESGSNLHEASIDEVNSILDETEDKNLVSRPFRNDKDRSLVEGICFCCDCCCEYFTKPEEVCDKGQYIEKTDESMCNFCGDCVDVCYFKAREVEDDKLSVNHDNCYGCGLCAKVCPEECVEMAARV